MKGWRLWTLLALILCLPVLLSRSTDPHLLQDSDTAFLLKVIRERQAPMSWFGGDWPLQNHFYRPLPTLTFELDNALYGNNAAGYGWTNAILCALCVLALFWVLAELSTSPLWAFSGAALFAIWNLDLGGALGRPLLWAIVPVLILGLYRHSLKIVRYLPAALVLLFLAVELSVPQVGLSLSLKHHMIGWLPGRTASVMTLFALIAAACYLRYERSRNRLARLEPATATDRPTATRTGTASTPRNPHLWLGLSYVAAAAALASYEQAVMLPAVLLGFAILLRWRGRLPAWWAHAGFWALLVGYLALRHFMLPGGTSGYQAQQLRSGPGVYGDLAGYLLPNAYPLLFTWSALTESIVTVLSPTVYNNLLAAAATATTAWQTRRNWRMVVAGWALSALAFLPMAWVKPFGHYHYWPIALRTILILGLAKVAWDLVSIAACPPALQAPKRPSPAPGSLPRP